jgi:hypothetical protein
MTVRLEPGPGDLRIVPTFKLRQGPQLSVHNPNSMNLVSLQKQGVAGITDPDPIREHLAMRLRSTLLPLKRICYRVATSWDCDNSKNMTSPFIYCTQILCREIMVLFQTVA